MTKGKSLGGHHLVITRRASIIILIILIITSIIIFISRSLWRKRWRRSKTTKASLSTGNATGVGVHLTHLIGEMVKTSIHPLKLCHDGLQSHTNYRRRRSRYGRSREGGRKNRSSRIVCLCLWPLQSKLGLALLNKTCNDGTHGGEERRVRNRNGEVSEDTRDSRRKDELITCSRILIHI